MVLLDRIYCAEEERQRADKALRLNGITSDNNPIVKLSKTKPTLNIKRLGAGPGIKLKGASSLQRQLDEKERIKAEKALRLNI